MLNDISFELTFELFLTFDTSTT